jgi:ubiquitin carboxyl-terminal hydrolase 4/11/15
MTKLLCEIFEDKITICQEGYDSQASFHSSISQHEENLTLYQCIHQFSTPEILKKFWFCNDECKETRAVKQMQLCSLSRVLIVQLKRFTDENGYMRKLDMYVDFPLNGLDSSKFYPDTNHCQSNVIYDLIAVSNHIGSAYGGHYTAYARQSVDEPWYLFNDSRVTRLSGNDRIVSRDAYILVYLRREKDENNSEI